MSKTSRKYNVLILTNVRWWNATAFYAVNIGRILKQNGHRVTIGCRKKYPAYQKARACGLKAVSLGFDGLKLPSLIKNFFKLVRYIRKHDIHIINAHRSEDHTFALLAKRVTGVKVVVTRGDRRRISRGPLSLFKYRTSDAVILTCKSILEKNRHIFDAATNNVQVIYGSVDEKRLVPTGDKQRTMGKYGFDAGKRVVGISGRLSPVKGHITFIKAAANVLETITDVAFVVAGKNVEIKRSELIHTLEQMGIADHFTLLGEIDDIADVMNTFDIGVITSIGSETISRVLLEYMALQKPVIGTRINAIGEIIQPGVNGALVLPGDPTALADEIKKLLSDASLMNSYGRNSLRLYRQNFSEGRCYEKTMQVFDGIFALDA